MEKDQLEINEETRIPLKAVVAIVVFCCALVGWGSRVESAASAVAASITSVQTAQMQYAQDIDQIKLDLALIKDRLGIPKDARPSR